MKKALSLLFALVVGAGAFAAEGSARFDAEGRLSEVKWGEKELLAADKGEAVIDGVGGLQAEVGADGRSCMYTSGQARFDVAIENGDGCFTLTVTVENTGQEPLKEYVVSLAGWKFVGGVAGMDPRFSGWVKNKNLVENARIFDRWITYPGWGFAPFTAAWDKDFTVGVSVHEPSIPYCQIYQANAKGNDPHRIQFKMTDPVEVGGKQTRKFVVAFGAGGDWQATARPYREFLHNTWPGLKLRNVGPFHHTYTRREYFDKENQCYQLGTTWDMLMMPGARQAAAVGASVAIFKGLFPSSAGWGLNSGKGHEFNPNYEQLAEVTGGAAELKKTIQKVKALGLIPATMTRVGVGIDEKGRLVRRDFSDPEQVEDQLRRIRKLIEYGFEGAYADQLAGFPENYRTIPLFLKRFQEELGDKFFMLAEHDWDILAQYTHIIVNAPPGQTDALLAQYLTSDTHRYLAAKFANPDWKTGQQRRKYAIEIGCIPWWLGPHFIPRVIEHDEAQIAAEWWRRNWDKVTVRPNRNFIWRYLPEYAPQNDLETPWRTGGEEAPKGPVDEGTPAGGFGE